MEFKPYGGWEIQIKLAWDAVEAEIVLLKRAQDAVVVVVRRPRD